MSVFYNRFVEPHDLIDIMKQFNTDKWLHGYEQTYSRILKTYTVSSLLEIGILHGWSLLGWRQILAPNAFVHGIDLNQPLHTGDIAMDRADIQYAYGIDSTCQGKIYDAALQVGKLFWPQEIHPDAYKYDCIIDDGSHDGKDQWATFQNFHKHFRKVYVIEDIVGKDSADTLESLIHKQGYVTLTEPSLRYSTARLNQKDTYPLKRLPRERDVYIMTVARPGTDFGNTYCRKD